MGRDFNSGQLFVLKLCSFINIRIRVSLPPSRLMERSVAWRDKNDSEEDLVVRVDVVKDIDRDFKIQRRDGNENVA